MAPAVFALSNCARALWIALDVAHPAASPAIRTTAHKTIDTRLIDTLLFHRISFPGNASTTTCFSLRTPPAVIAFTFSCS
jgi:hypothetical protein